MKTFFTTMVLLLFAGFTYAQTGSIKGKISTSDGKPAEYVNVSIKGTSKGAISDGDGRFEIRKISAGSHLVLASFVGFDPIERTVEIHADETTIVEFILNETSAQLSEIIVRGEREGYKVDVVSSSLRLQSSLLETPQNIQVVTGDVLKAQQVISMSDGLIRNVSGLTKFEHWGDMYTNIQARGSQIQAFRNGFNVVNSGWGPLTEDMSFVDHIEFVKGPAGFMLSSGDPSGLYNVVTKKPTGQTKGEASLTLGSYGLFRTTLDLDGKLSSNGKLLYRLNLSAQNKKSHRANEFNDRYVIAPVISYQVDDNTKLTLEYNYQRASMSNVGSYYVFTPEDYATLPVDFTILPAGMPATNINDHSLYFTLEHNFNANWKITGQVSRFMYNQIGSSMWAGLVDPDGTFIRNVGIWDAKSSMTMGQVFLNGTVTTGPVRHRILAGLDMASKNYIADWGQSHNLDSANAPFDPKNPNLGIPGAGYPVFDRSTPLDERAQAVGGLMNQRYSSLYVQDELGFLDNKVRLTLAGRYTYLEQSAYGGPLDEAKHFTPRVGLSGSINSSTSAYALYDQAFIPQSGILTNGDKVKPITGNNMEVGIKKNWFNDKWNTTLSVYRITKRNELTPDPNSPPTSNLSIVFGEKRSQGVEFDLRGTIAKGLDLIANYAYTDSKVTEVAEGVTAVVEGQDLLGYAKHTINSWLSYKIENGILKGAGVSAGFTWLLDRSSVGDAYWGLPTSKRMGDYFKVDAGLFYEIENFKITANVFNIADEYLYSGAYYQWSNAYYYQTEAPRNFRISVNYKF